MAQRGSRSKRWKLLGEHFTLEELSKIPEQKWTGPDKYPTVADTAAEISRPVCRNGVAGIQMSDG